MMDEILGDIQLKNQAKFSKLLSQCMVLQRMLNSMDLDNPVYEFKIQKFFKELPPLLSEYPRKERMSLILELSQNIFKHFGYELSLSECFVLFELREIGKFRLKDDKFFATLDKSWQEYSDYRLDKDEFKYALKELKNIKLIDLRRGAIMMSPEVVLH